VKGALVAIALGVLGVALTQPSLARGLHAAKAREDVYLFPPPEQLRVATLGYRAAVVDMLWVKLRIENGIHLLEKRPFPDAPHYFDALLELEPDFPPAFKYVDSMLCYREGSGEREARLTRAYLERGIAARPNDHEVWLRYGQFLAFMGGSFLTSKEEIEQWRVDGAAALARAVELGDDPDRSLAAASLLSSHGANAAAVRVLEQTYALTDDEQERENIARKLADLHAEDVRDRAKNDLLFIESIWRDRWPFLPRTAVMLVGPGRDTLKCAGHEGSSDPACALGWSERVPSSKER
jgi:hypothetical protein